jgi:polyisoprenoid-binding protein YceI
MPGLAALAVLLMACGGAPAGPSASTPAGGAASPAASPQGPTPTVLIAAPAPSPSPVAAASPSPIAAASPSPAALASPSPVAVAAASPSPVAAAGSTGGTLYRVAPERSEARYEVQEKFAERPLPSQAVGRTKDVSGEIELEGSSGLRGRVLQMRVDLRTLASDSTRRDAFIRQNTLQTDQFPFAEFRSTEAAGPAAYSEGTEAAFQIPGIMTIKGRERPLTWDATAKVEGGRLTGTATARIKLTDFGVEPPRLAILTVEDDMTWVVQLDAERAQ